MTCYQEPKPTRASLGVCPCWSWPQLLPYLAVHRRLGNWPQQPAGLHFLSEARGTGPLRLSRGCEGQRLVPPPPPWLSLFPTQTQQTAPRRTQHHVTMGSGIQSNFPTNLLLLALPPMKLPLNCIWISWERSRRWRPPPPPCSLWKSSSQPALFGKMLQ